VTQPPETPLSVEGIRGHLTTHTIGAALHVHDEVDSTNRLAAEMAQAGAPDGTVVIAEAQTRGRGRLGRHWLSPRGLNVYLSVILTRLQSPELLAWTPLMAGIAVVRAIKRVTGLAARLKWPNDVVSPRDGPSRKLAGILSEVAEDGPSRGPAIVVGIGINVNMPMEAFPEDLRPTATSLLVETGGRVDRSQLLAALLFETEGLYEHLLMHGPADLRAAYHDLSDTLGKQVRIELAGRGHLEGTAEAIAADGALRLRARNGTVLEIRAGDVVHLR
jgi:BirA family biotin operon repressor/biotin-[acetyl-CoA-carboxylase] ligase